MAKFAGRCPNDSGLEMGDMASPENGYLIFI